MCMFSVNTKRESRVQDTVYHMKMGVRNKMDMAKFTITTISTLVFKWYVVRSGSKNIHQTNTCSKEIGLLALHSMLNG